MEWHGVCVQRVDRKAKMHVVMPLIASLIEDATNEMSEVGIRGKRKKMHLHIATEKSKKSVPSESHQCRLGKTGLMQNEMVWRFRKRC